MSLWLTGSKSTDGVAMGFLKSEGNAAVQYASLEGIAHRAGLVALCQWFTSFSLSLHCALHPLTIKFNVSENLMLWKSKI